MRSVALVGAGRMGTVHARSFAGHARLRLACVIDTDAARRAALAREAGAVERELEEALADKTIEGVLIASSTDMHLAHALAAVRAGKAVFCEKPLDLDVERLHAARAELTAPGVRLFVGFNRRFDVHFRALKSRVENGEIGALESLHIVNHDPAPPPLAFIPASGGLFRDFTIHDFDVAAWLLDEAPGEVFASASCLVDPKIAELGDIDTARIILRTPRGRLCTISNTRRSGYGYDQRIEAYGSKGAARVDNLLRSAVSVIGAQGPCADALQPSFVERYALAYRAELDHFADVLEGVATPAAGFAENVRALTLARAAAESAASGKMVRA